MPELETAGGEDAHHIAEYGERGKCDQRGKRGGVAKLRGYLLLGIAVGKLEGKMLLIFRCHIVGVLNTSLFQFIRELSHKFILFHRHHHPTKP